MFAIAAALMISAPAAGTAAAPPPPAAVGESKAKAPDLGEMMKMFDKLFPAQAEPEPQRLDLAQQSVRTLLPDGAYGRMMGDMMDGLATKVLSMSDADFGGKSGQDKARDPTTLHDKLAKGDPHFDERMAIVRRIAGDELARLSAILEPRLRTGLARSMARRLDRQQLTDLNAFLSTDSGQAYGRQSMAMWVDPDVMRSIVGAMPEMIMAMPGIFQRIERETAHLPKPTKPKAVVKKEKPSS